MPKTKLLTFLLIFLSFSAILGFYNFDSASAYTGTITYDSGTNTITCVGGSSSTPITFNDLYLADVAGSWGKISKQGVNQFLINCKLVIGDGITITYFSDIDKQITIDGTGADGVSAILVKTNATLTLGVLLSATTKATARGCSIILLWNNNYPYIINCNAGTVNIFGGSISAPNTNYAGLNIFTSLSQVYNVQFLKGNMIRLIGNADLFNNAIFNVGQAFEVVNIDNLIITKASMFNMTAQAIIKQGNYHLTFVDAYARGCTNLALMRWWGAYNLYFINADVDNWNFAWQNSGSDTGKIYRQYTFDLNVLNGEITDFVQNATVQLWKDSSKIYEGITNSSGMIPTQTLTYGYYQQATGDTIQNATSPYYLVITHPDWQTYISRFYITEPLRLTVSMQEPTYTGYTEAEKSDYTTIILFVISLILCIIGLALTVPLLPLIALTVSVINVLLLTEISVFNILLIILNIIFTVITIVRTKTKNN